MRTDPILRQVLDLVLRQRHDPSNQFVFVSSPPGGGKTQLVEVVAVAACQLGLQVSVTCPRAEQVFALVRRLLRAYPTQRLRLLIGKDRPLPADLEARAIPMGGGCFDFGSGDGPLLAVATVAKLASLAASGAVTCDLLICDESYQVTLAEFAPSSPVRTSSCWLGTQASYHPWCGLTPSPLPPPVSGYTSRLPTSCGATGQPPRISGSRTPTACHRIPCHSCSRSTRIYRFAPRPHLGSAD